MSAKIEDALRVLVEYGNASTDPEVQDAIATVNDYLTTFNDN